MQFNISSQGPLNDLARNFATKAHRKRFGVGQLLLITIVGLTFLGVGYLLISNNIKSKDWPTATGIVSSVNASTDNKGNTTYTPTVTYQVGGKSYNWRSNVSSSASSSVGTSMSVVYNPSNPSDATTRITGIGEKLLYLLPVIGVIILITGPIGFARSRKRTESITYLKQSGQKVTGVISDIRQDMQGDSSSANGLTTTSSSITRCQIIVTANDPSSNPHLYTSDWVEGNTMGLMGFRTTPIAIDVYVDPANTDNYYVDIDEIPGFSFSTVVDLVKNAQSGTAQPVTSVAPGQPIAPIPTSMPTHPIPPQPVQTVQPIPQSEALENRGEQEPPTGSS